MKRYLAFTTFLGIMFLSFSPLPQASASSASVTSAKQYCKNFIIARLNWGAGVVRNVAVSTNYALCEVSDTYTGNVFLFKVQGATYEIVASGKPMFGGVSDLESRGKVPTSEAQILWAGINVKSTPTPTPQPTATPTPISCPTGPMPTPTAPTPAPTPTPRTHPTQSPSQTPCGGSS